jgi:hypothetical protein
LKVREPEPEPEPVAGPDEVVAGEVGVKAARAKDQVPVAA